MFSHLSSALFLSRLPDARSFSRPGPQSASFPQLFSGFTHSYGSWLLVVFRATKQNLANIFVFMTGRCSLVIDRMSGDILTQNGANAYKLVSIPLRSRAARLIGPERAPDVVACCHAYKHVILVHAQETNESRKATTADLSVLGSSAP